MTKYCKDCVYCKRKLPIRFSVCTNANAYEEFGGDRFISPKHAEPLYCSIVRGRVSLGLPGKKWCGPEATYFEAKAPTIIDRMIDWLNKPTYPK